MLPLSLRPRRARDGHYSDKLLGGRGRALRRSAAIAAAAILCGITFRAMFERTVQSRRPLLSELAGVDPPTVALLRAAGIPTPERLSRAVRSSGLAAVANRTGVHPERLRRASRHAALSLHKGMGTRAAALLENAGIASVADLAKAEPEALFRKLSGAVRLSQVKVWIRSARLSGQPRR